MKSKKDAAPAQGEIKMKEPILVVRTCDKNMKGHGGFPWPVSGPIEAPEKWNPKWGPVPSPFKGGFDPSIQCGAGLHAVHDPFDNFGFLDFSLEAKALVVKTDATTLARVDGKVKFRFGIVEQVTTLADALCRIICTAANITRKVTEIQKNADLESASAERLSKLAASGDASKLAASGYASKLAASGDASKLAASGDASKLAASGDASQLAASGYASKLAASGDASQLAASGDASKLAASGYASKLAASGDDSQLAASGDDSQLAASGYASKLAASGNASQLAASGDDSQLAASGNASQLAASGDDSQLAASGDDSQLAASGDDSVIAAAGGRSMAKVGKNGAIALPWHDGTRWRFAVAYEGEDGIEANVWYSVENGKFVKAA